MEHIFALVIIFYIAIFACIYLSLSSKPNNPKD